MSPFMLACVAYLTVALPSSTLGLLWPSMRTSFHQPLAALGILLTFGTVASVISSAATPRILTRLGGGLVLAIGAAGVALALAVEALASSLWVVVVGATLFSLGFGAIDSSLNVHAAYRFGARQVNWMHASFGLGATIGPLMVTAMMAGGVGWRWTYGTFAIVILAVGILFALFRNAWKISPVAPATGAPSPAPRAPEVLEAPAHSPPLASVLGVLTFTAVETGIESGVGIWGYVFLTAGRGLPSEAAGVAVSAYWAMMVMGRAVLGSVAERVGATRVLSGAVVGVAVGAAIMGVPGTAALGVVGMMVLGLAAAPIFPLLTLTTPQRLGNIDHAGTAQMVSFQVAASAVGSAVLPSAMGVIIGALSARALAPLLLVLAVAMGGVYLVMSPLSRRGTS